MRKFALALATTALTAVAVSSASFAETAAPNFNGFSAGVQFGGDIARGKGNLKSGLKTAGNQNAQVLAQGTDLGALGFTAGIHADWKKVFANNFMVGAGIFWDFSNARGQSDTLAQTGADEHPKVGLKVKLKNNYGLDLKFGRMIGHTLASLRVGVSSGSWEISADTADINTGAVNATGSLKKTKRSTGLRLGASMETKLTEKVSLGMHYTFTVFKKVENTGDVRYGTTGAGANNQDYTVNTKYTPYLHTVGLRLSYHFGG